MYSIPAEVPPVTIVSTSPVIVASETRIANSSFRFGDRSFEFGVAVISMYVPMIAVGAKPFNTILPSDSVTVPTLLSKTD